MPVAIYAMRLTRNAKVGQTPAQRAPVTPRSARRRGRTPGLNLGVAGAAASFAGRAAAAVRRRRAAAAVRHINAPRRGDADAAAADAPR